MHPLWPAALITLVKHTNVAGLSFLWERRTRCHTWSRPRPWLAILMQAACTTSTPTLTTDLRLMRWTPESNFTSSSWASSVSRGSRELSAISTMTRKAYLSYAKIAKSGSRARLSSVSQKRRFADVPTLSPSATQRLLSTKTGYLASTLSVRKSWEIAPSRDSQTICSQLRPVSTSQTPRRGRLLYLSTDSAQSSIVRPPIFRSICQGRHRRAPMLSLRLCPHANEKETLKWRLTSNYFWERKVYEYLTKTKN